MPTTRTVTSLTQHNAGNSAKYDKADFPIFFKGQTTHDGTTLVAINSALEDDSQNPSAPMVVSTESLHSMMPAGWPGRIVMFMQAWWGRSSRPAIGFNNWAAADTLKIFQFWKACGVDVVVVDWYGISRSGAADDGVLDLMHDACTATGLKWFIGIDQLYFTGYGNTPADQQGLLTSAMEHFNTKGYFTDPTYEHVTWAGASRPLMWWWNCYSTTKGNIDWLAAWNSLSFTPKPAMMHFNQNEWTVPNACGCGSWLSTGADTATDPSGADSFLTKGFLPTVKSHASQIAMSSAWPGFNGTMTKSLGGTGWSYGKYIARQDGVTWYKSWKANSDFVAAGNELEYVDIVTADDFQEGTAVQGGIRNNAKVTASLTGNIVTFSLTAGNELTIRQYNLWGSMDGQTAYLLGTVKPGVTKQFDLTKVSAPATGNYTLWVEAQGLPMVQNVIAPSLTANIGTTTTPPPPPPPSPTPTPTPTPNTGAPVAVLTSDVQSGVLPLTVNFDGSASFDLYGNIVDWRFDWGDGTAPLTPNTNQTPTHVFNSAGSFVAQLTVTDDKGTQGIGTVVITVTTQDVQVSPGGQLPPPPPPPPPLPTSDPSNPIKVTTPSPVPTPDPGRSLCTRFRKRHVEVHKYDDK